MVLGRASVGVGYVLVRGLGLGVGHGLWSEIGYGLWFVVGHELWFRVRREVGNVIGFGVWHGQLLVSYSGIFALFRLERLLKSFHTNTQ